MQSDNLNFVIFPKQKHGFFPEKKDLPLLEVTSETGCGTDCKLHAVQGATTTLH